MTAQVIWILMMVKSSESNHSETLESTANEWGTSDSMNTYSDTSNGISSLCLPDTVARIANQFFQWKLQSSKTVDRQYRKRFWSAPYD